MASTKHRIAVAGSERAAVPGAKLVGAVNPNEQVLVTIVVRRRSGAKALTNRATQLGSKAVAKRNYLSREEFEATHGADPKDMKAVAKFAADNGLQVVESSAAQRRVVLSGTVAAVSKAFGVFLARYQHEGGTYRGRTGDVHIPADLAGVIEGVFGLDNRPQARTHFRMRPVGEGIAAPRAAGGTFTPPEVAALYNFPSGTDGGGQCIGVIELGGGYRKADLTTYFKQLGMQAPKVSSKSVDGGKNKPTGNANSADGEVVLDIEVAGAVAPKAKIVVYFAPNTDAGFLDAISTAVHDKVNKPSVISISWGAAEAQWTAQAMQAMDQVFQDAAALGVTVCCAAGDDGSRDNVQDGRLHADFPASSPFALACGGTRLAGSGGTIASEVVWNEGATGGATGGGVSDMFPLPAWQKKAKVPHSANPGGHVGRGVPDVAGNADPNTGYQIRVDGQEGAIGGTSAVAPLWAGLIARLNQHLGKPAGYLNPALYQLPTKAGAFRDIVSGNNNVSTSSGPYPARTGWDACCGLGSPVGAKLATAL
jgi:kumamolisin